MTTEPVEQVARSEIERNGLTIRARRGSQLPQERDGRLILDGRYEWVVTGPADAIADIAKSMPASAAEPLGNEVLVLAFGNSVGRLDLPALGAVEVVSGKLDSKAFDEMLADLTEKACALPFAADALTALPYDRSLATRQDILYHAFVYLRHVLSEDTPNVDRLDRALDVVVRDPHRRLTREPALVPIGQASRADPSSLLGVVQGVAPLVPVKPEVSTWPLAQILRGKLPTSVLEQRAISSVDTPENRFVKAFVSQARAIVEAMRETVAQRSTSAIFGRQLRIDCDHMDGLLGAITRHSLWSEVGVMTHVPLSSVVLQRRAGYRQVLRHFAKLRLAAHVPLDLAVTRYLLEAKDIALLYELWCYFSVADGLERLLGKPNLARAVQSDQFQATVPRAMVLNWPDGTTLWYNRTFSRSQPARLKSYSVELRPDIALSIPTGVHAGLHLFDAKFRVDGNPLGNANDALTEEAEERLGTYKRADLYKMHTYRDAILDARSAWVLYPGTGSRTEFRVKARTRIEDQTGLLVKPDEALLDGVGAVPLYPSPELSPALIELLRHLVGSS